MKLYFVYWADMRHTDVVFKSWVVKARGKNHAKEIISLHCPEWEEDYNELTAKIIDNVTAHRLENSGNILEDFTD